MKWKETKRKAKHSVRIEKNEKLKKKKQQKPIEIG